MRGVYLRWGGALALAALIGALGAQRYYQEVATVSPERLLHNPPQETVRVLGRVEGGSLVKDPLGKEARFQLSGEKERIAVHYIGDDSDTLRELKTIVVMGEWNGAAAEFTAKKIALIPNYGFITAAYLIALIPMGLFLFNMERKVALLYTRIKQEKVYQPGGSS